MSEGTAIPSWSVCWLAELVVRGSGCHRARDGDQDTLSEHQKNPCRRDGTRTEYWECEPSHGLRMEVTMHSTFKLERRDPWRWCPELGRADGEQSSEDLPSQSRLRAVGSQRGLSCVQAPENWSRTTTSSQRRMPEEDLRPAGGRSGWVHTTGCG